MNVNTSAEEREKAPAWLASWSKSWNKRDRAQYERSVFRCERCAKSREKTPDRGFWHYGWPGEGFTQLQLQCGHFIKVGEPLPPEA